MKFISLFAGIGGFDLALTRQGHECVYANDFDKYATKIYTNHFGSIDSRDIRQVPTSDVPDHDLLCGGFPCQAFSIAGHRKGFDDTRGTLFFEVARILKAKQPRLLLLENVKGLLSHDGGRTFKTIIATLTELGYDLQWQVLNSKAWVPQNRERIYIVGNFRGTSRPQVFPILQTNGSDGQMELRHDPPRQISPTVRTPGGGHHIPTITDGAKTRRLTPKECERLQGFPDDWTAGLSDTQRYKCLGNAVTVNTVEAVTKRL